MVRRLFKSLKSGLPSFILKKNGTYQVDGKEWYAYNDTTNKIYYFDESDTYEASKIITKLGLKNNPSPVITMHANWKEEEQENSYGVKAESIHVLGNKNKISIKEKLDLNVIYKPNNAQEEKVFWSSSDDKIAKVYKGVVTGLSKGTVTITARTKSN